MNTPRRVLLAHDPADSLRPLLESVVNIIPVDRVGNQTNRHNLFLMTKPAGDLWVIAFLSAEGQMPVMLDALLLKYPRVSILAVTAHGDPTAMKWMEFPAEIMIGVPSAQLAVGLYTAFLSNMLPHSASIRASRLDSAPHTLEGAHPDW